MSPKKTSELGKDVTRQSDPLKRGFDNVQVDQECIENADRPTSFSTLIMGAC